MGSKHNKNIPQSSSFILAKNKELVVSKERANEQWDLAHLELEDVLYDMDIPDPFEDMTEEDFKHPDRFVMSLMLEPDYFGWTCKHLFGIDLLPMQCAILKELWYRPFPMLIASRGFGKCTTKSTLVVTNKGIRKLGDLIDPDFPVFQPNYQTDLSILGENTFVPIEYIWNNGYTETIKVTTRCGFDLEGTLNHPIRIVRDKIDWCNHEDLKIGDYVVIDRNNTDWPTHTNNLTEEEGYLFGALVGDGGYTVAGRIGFTTADYEMMNPINSTAKKIWGKEFKKYKAKYTYGLSSKEAWTSLFTKYGFNSSVCAEKDFPSSVLSSRKEVMAAFIRGLMDTDGTATRAFLGVEFASKSKNLVNTLQFVLTRFGITSKVLPKLNKKYNRYYYYLYIIGDNARKFGKEIGFSLKRKQDILEGNYSKVSNTNIDVIPKSLVYDNVIKLREKVIPNKNGVGERLKLFPSKYHLSKYDLSYYKLKLILDLSERFELTNEPEYKSLLEVYNNHYFYDKVVKLEKGYEETFDVHLKNDHSFISNGFISHNSFLISLYLILRALLLPGRKIVITGAGFRQSKIVFGYAEAIWMTSPILRDLCGGGKAQGPHHDTDVWYMGIGDSVIKALPLGSGDKIRGQRANDIAGDEFGSIPRDIFEHVVAGFGVVAQDPVEQVKERIRISNAKKKGEWTQEQEIDSMNSMMPNQIILSGTAGYSFNHFAEYWRRYKLLVQSQGDQVKLAKSGINPKISWDSYSVIRIPVELLPQGFMDEDQVERAAATINTDVYTCEYGACFSIDSNGFYKRSLIEKCSVNPRKPITLPSGEVEVFHTKMQGDPGCKYIYGIDPAATKDSFAICILEIHVDHARVVHMWTTNKGDHETRLANKQKISNNYFAFCVRKIRDLMKVFPCEVIAMDSGGGGRTIAEAFKDKMHIEDGELPILEVEQGHVLWDGKPKASDGEAGLHILELLLFGEAKYTYEANNGLKNDFEHQRILFPFYDPIELVLAGKSDMEANREFDTLEEVISEIEELKNEITIIQHSETDTGKERWAAPEVKDPNSNKKGRSHDDRYSAFLMANMAARRMRLAPKPIVYEPAGGFVGQSGPRIVNPTGQLYIGPAWLQEKIKQAGVYGTYVQREKD